MAKVANKFQALPVEDDVDITSKIKDVVASAMALIPDRPRGRGTAAATRDSSKELVGDIVKAVVAAVLPMIHSLSTQIATNHPHIEGKNPSCFTASRQQARRC